MEKLSRGETAFEDEETEGSTKSLAASLNCGFENTFSADERKILALLYFFQGFVDVDVLKVMGDPDEDYALPALRNQTREIFIPLLDRAAEVGLLTALGGGCYTIHPALPWFFKGFFEKFFPKDHLPERAFVRALGELGEYYLRQYSEGIRDVIALLTREESNFLHARYIARTNEWWHLVIDPIQGLSILYDHSGRRAEWKRLVEEITSDFVDPATARTGRSMEPCGRIPRPTGKRRTKLDRG